MEILKSLAVNSPYQSTHTPINWDSVLFAKIAFLDKTNSPAEPHLYKLKDSLLDHTQIEGLNLSSLHSDSFVYLGTANNIDKINKLISMENKNILSYEHLIIISGSHSPAFHRDESLIAGLQTLVETLKVKSKFLPEPPPSSNDHSISLCPSLKSNLETTKFKQLLSTTHHTPSNLSSHNGRLYEIQL